MVGREDHLQHDEYGPDHQQATGQKTSTCLQRPNECIRRIWFVRIIVANSRQRHSVHSSAHHFVPRAGAD